MKNTKRAFLAFMSAAFLVVTPMQAVLASSTESISTTESTESSEVIEAEKSAVDAKNGMITTDDFVINVRCGIDGTYRTGAAIPINVDIESINEDFEGLIRIIVPGNSDYGSMAVAYEREMLLSAGTPKNISMSVYSGMSTSIMYLQIEDSKGKIIIDQGVKMNTKAGENALVGILSDDYTALNYFDKAEIDGVYSGSIELVELSEDMITDQASSIEALSYIIINSYDTSQLSPEQITSIKNWVSAGGVLILGLGSDYSKTLSGIGQDFVAGDISGNLETTATLDDSKLEKKPEEPVLSYKPEDGALKLSVKDAKPLAGIFTEEGLVWDHEYKQGHVIVTAMNLGMNPIVDWKAGTAFAGRLLSEAANGYSASRISTVNYGNSQDQWAITSCLNGLGNFKVPHSIAIGIILGIFIIICPIIYIPLKKLDKRELMWIVIPVASVVFTGLIFISNRDLRIKYPLTSSVTVMYDDGDESGLSKSVYCSYLVPSADMTSVKMNTDIATLNILSDDDYYDMMSSTIVKDYNSAIREGADGYTISFNNGRTFDSTCATFEYVGEHDMGNGFDVKLNKTISGISGTITNNTGKDLKGAGIFFYGKRVLIGDLANGETATIEEKDAVYNTDEQMYDIDVPGTFKDENEKGKIASIMQMIYRQYMSNDLEGIGNQNSTYIFAVDMNYVADYVADENVVETNAAVCLQRVNLGFCDYKDASLCTLGSKAEYTEKWDSYDGQMYDTEVELVADLSDEFYTLYGVLRASDKDARFGKTDYTDIYIWNLKTEKYEQIFVGDDKDKLFEIKDNSLYMDEEGKVKFKLTCQTAYDNYAPVITIVGGEE